jgi:hypothetical protein
MFRSAFDKRAERRMRRHKSTPSQLSLFSRVSSFKKLKKKLKLTTHHKNLSNNLSQQRQL